MLLPARLLLYLSGIDEGSARRALEAATDNLKRMMDTWDTQLVLVADRPWFAEYVAEHAAKQTASQSFAARSKLA